MLVKNMMCATRSPRLGKFITSVVASLALAAAIGTILIGFFSWMPGWIFLYDNADLLYLPVLFRDLFHNGGHLQDWYLPPAPYVFPDYLLFGVAYVVGHGALQQAANFAVLQTLCFAAVLFFLYRALSVRGAYPTSAFVVGVVVLLSLRNIEPFMHLVMSGFHFGSFLALLVSMTILINLTQTPDHLDRPRLGVLFLIVAGTVFSDGLTITNLAGPLAATALILPMLGRMRLRCAAVLTSVIVAAGGVGLIAQPLIYAHRMDYAAAVDLSFLPLKLASFWTLLGATPAISAGACGFFLFALLRTLQITISRRPASALDLVLVLACFSEAMSLSVPFAFDNVMVVGRYFIGFYLLPLVLAPAWLWHLQPALSSWLATFATVGVAAVLLASGTSLGMGHKLHGSYYPDEVACLDRAVVEHHYHFGVAGYWDAKFLQALSRNGIAPAQYSLGPVEFRWITTSRAYQPSYDYAIVSERAPPPIRLDRDSIETTVGPSDVVVECGPFTLLGYDGRRMVLQSAP